MPKPVALLNTLFLVPKFPCGGQKMQLMILDQGLLDWLHQTSEIMLSVHYIKTRLTS